MHTWICKNKLFIQFTFYFEIWIIKFFIMCQASGDDINAVLESKLDYKLDLKSK